MIRNFLSATVCIFMFAGAINCQTLSIDKVQATYLRNSGTIMENNQIKGYFFLYLSDKINRKTNEYTLQILDQNINKVIDIKFEDSKNINLLEASYNNNSLAFLFRNNDEKTLDIKVYSIDGKLKYTYTRAMDKKTQYLLSRYASMNSDEGTNQNIFDIGLTGYAAIIPVREGRETSYEVDYYSSQNNKQWTFVPQDDEARFSNAEFLGNTDSLIILQVMKKNRTTSNKVNPHLVAVNFVTKKLAFDIDNENDEYTFVPSSVVPVKGEGRMLVMGNYFEKGDKIQKEYSTGIAVYEVSNKGKILSKTYNSWTTDFAAYLPMNRKGKIESIGYLFIHKLIQTPDGKLFVVGEGYKRQANAGGIALFALGALSGVNSNAGVTKIVVTDMVMMEFSDKFKITNATIFDKTNNNAIVSNASDYMSQHSLALYLKMTGSFDYEFTTGDEGFSNFIVCYSDWVRSSEYKGQTFNSIRYNGEKFITDKIELKSKASRMKVFPAKPGSVMILEYFRKARKLEFRIEKLG
jgi:hypothetical protein